MSYLLTEGSILQSQKIELCEGLSLPALHDYIRHTIGHVSKTTVYSHGSLDAEAAVSGCEAILHSIQGAAALSDPQDSPASATGIIAEILPRSAIAASSSTSDEVISDRSRMLPTGNTALILPAFNQEDPNNAYVLFLQMNKPVSPRLSALLMTLRRLWGEPAFNTLRTQKQLGYIVSLSLSGYGR